MAWRGQLSRKLKELRILLCQTSPSSAPARSFVENNYKDLKTLNPKLPILIRECSGIEPQMWARYDVGQGSQALLTKDANIYFRCIKDMGVERGIRLEGLTEPQILKALEDLVKAGASAKA